MRDAYFVVRDIVAEFGVGIQQHPFQHTRHVGRFFKNTLLRLQFAETEAAATFSSPSKVMVVTRSSVSNRSSNP